MKDVKVVIGANFGDEGKGLITDYLAHKFEKANNDRTLVVRFNGGAQAGHTVKVGNTRHVFHHIGSGTIRGAATYLSKHFVSSPMLFKKELDDLWEKGIRPPMVYVSAESQITTPYDIMINQRLEQLRGESRHGSCGIGFNETIQRYALFQRPSVILPVGIIPNTKLFKDTVDYIRVSYVPRRLNDLGIDLDESLLMSDEIFYNFIEDCKHFFFNTVVVPNEETVLERYNYNIVFEGAQGLRLDKDYGEFPFVTHSNTGLKNVFDIIGNIEYESMEVYYVSRGYLTRHGAGPLENEYNEKPYEAIVDETNIHNDYQGSLRFAPLDIDRMCSYIQQDVMNHNDKNFDVVPVITCLDHIPNEEEIRVVGEMEKHADGKMLVSYGPEAKDVCEIVSAKLD